MRLLLDTHALLWRVADERRLSAAQREALERSTGSGERLGLSAISFWEIAKLLERGRLRLPRSADQLFEELESHPELDIHPLTPRISSRARASAHASTPTPPIRSSPPPPASTDCDW